MRRIGIFLGADPGSGGTFQYSLSMLDALAALQRGDQELVAAFFNPAWRAYLEPSGARPLMLGNRDGREPLGPGRFWRTALLPVEVWRERLWRLDPVARALEGQHCTFWLFPGQDHWSYLAPVSALTSVHDLMHRYEPQFPEVSRWGRFAAREYRFRNICRFAAAVIADSELGRAQLAESYGLNAERSHALPYIPPRYILASAVSDGFDRRYTLPHRFFFYPAQFWPHKNHARLLEALAVARRTCPDIALVLAGPKRYDYRRIARRVAQLELSAHVAFTGYLPDADLPEFYRRARALVMPTFFGPTNIPPLEAFALGCPVALSDIYASAEQVGDAALLFDPRSVEQIAEALVRLWTDDRLCTRLAALGKERAARWGAPQFSARLARIISSLPENVPASSR